MKYLLIPMLIPKLIPILLATLLFIPHAADAQSYFELTPEGFVSGADPKSKLLTIEYPRETKAELYTKGMAVIQSRYHSPEEKITVVNSESITFDGVKKKYIRTNAGQMLDLHYVITFEFRDEHIRIAAPHFTILQADSKREALRLVSTAGDPTPGIFDKQKKLQQKPVKQGLEKFFVDFMRNFKTQISLIN